MQAGVTMVTGPRLRGTAKPTKEFLLRTVTRGEGAPFLETAGSLGYANQPAIAVVIRLAEDRHKVDGGHYKILGKDVFNTVIRLKKVWPHIKKAEDWVARIKIGGNDVRFGMQSPSIRNVSDWIDLEGT